MAEQGLFRMRCKGALGSDGSALSVELTLTCSRTGELSLAIDDVRPSTEVFGLIRAAEDPLNGALKPLVLRAVDEANRIVSSDSVYLISHGSALRSDGNWMTLSATASNLAVRERGLNDAAAAKGVTARYLVIGMRGWGVLQVDTRAGQLRLLADAKIEDYAEVTGEVTIVPAVDHASILNWLIETDKVLSEVLDVISLAEGRLLRWTIRELYGADGLLLALEFRGASVPRAGRAGFHHWLNLQPVLELAVTSYTSELKARTGIDVALEWALMNPSYLELEFLSCMVALEHLSNTYQSRQHGWERLDEAQASPAASEPDEVVSLVRRELEQLFSRLAPHSSPEKALLLRNLRSRLLGELGRRKLSDAVERMLAGYEVPMAGLNDIVLDLAKLRNDIVHRGVARESFQPTLLRQVLLLRELLTRIFLKLLNYTGKYDSVIWGETMFPPELKNLGGVGLSGPRVHGA